MEYREQPEIPSQPSEEEPETMDSETQESIEMEDKTLVIDEQTSQKLQEHLDYHQEMVKILSDVIHNKQLPRELQLPKLPAMRLKLLLGLKESKTKKMSGEELNEFLKSKLIIDTDHLNFLEIQSLRASTKVVHISPEVKKVSGTPYLRLTVWALGALKWAPKLF
ncbi:uncharacterized protein LOC141905156 [Tubulanus polymorphus]|uniref:uncharacterized protein LOC141905156 n=1 Tax=Tubulanus polymorphus TaxID=672921 RepID=UPI003DA44C8D